MAIQIFWDRVKQRIRREASLRFGKRPVSLAISRPIVSFTFDDFPLSALQVGGAILEDHGFAGTFYTSLGLAGMQGPVGRYFSEADLSGLLERGHELGCHTYDHCDAWLTPARDYEASILRNRQELQRVLPGAAFASHSYPISYPRPSAKAVVGHHFCCARGGEPGANGRKSDANSLHAIFIEKAGGDLAVTKRYIDHAVAAGSWLILATHDVSETPSPFGCGPQVFSELVRFIAAAGITVMPVSRVFASLRNDRTS